MGDAAHTLDPILAQGYVHTCTYTYIYVCTLRVSMDIHIYI
jgi:hypothetical protein